MKRAYFACLFLCLITTLLLSQANPASSASSTALKFPAVDHPSQKRHSRVATRQSGSGVGPLSTHNLPVSGWMSCTSDYTFELHVSSADMWASASPWIDDYPLATVDPNVPTAEVSCSAGFDGLNWGENPGNRYVTGGVGSQTTSLVVGWGNIDATCVVATGACTGNVSGEVELYSSLDNLLQSPAHGPLLGDLRFSGATSNCGWATEEENGLLWVTSLDCSFDMNSTVTGQETLADPVAQINVPLVPVAVPPGSPGFTLTVNGFGFVPQSTVNWNGSPRPTTFVSSSQLTAMISAADILAPATPLVTVSSPNSGSISNAADFSVTDPTSSISLGRSDVSVASQPESVVIGDFNQDGIPDLAVTSFSGAVSVLIGNGDGTFRGHVDYPTGAGARGVVTGDFNGDGKLDLAIANQTSNTVSILLGNGDGTFQGHVDYPAGAGPFSLATGDFDEDGALDLVVVNQTNNQVSVLLGVGDGTFVFSASYDTGQLPFGVVTGDFNQDGQLDLAVANYSDNTVSILLGNGDGTFGAHTDYATGPLPEMLATADLNADGKLDLAVGTDQATASQISILVGNGDGTFQPHNDFPAGSKPRSVIPVDLNGDGKVDLAVANYGSSTVSLLLGNGDGTFSSRIDYPTGASPQSITAGDFAGNGRLDLAVADYGADTASVLLQIPAVALSTSSLSFGLQAVGTTSAPQSITLTNTGSASLSVNGISVQGDFTQSNTCNPTIQPGNNCNISVTFTPTISGPRSGALTIADNAVNSPQTVGLSGTGTTVTTTTLSSSLNPSTFNQQVTFTATVTGQSGGTPTGSVTFSDGSMPLGTSPLSGSTATVSTAALTAGTHSITAVYSGNFSGSSASLNQTVNQASTTLVLTSSSNPSALGQLVIFTAAITSQYGGQAPGTVTFKDGATVLGSSAVSGNVASLTTSGLAIGTNSITAVYSGGGNFTGSTSNTVSQVVSKATTTLLSSINPSVQGKSVTFTAAVSSLAGTPTGKVQFLNGTAVLATVTLTSGSAKYTTSKLPAGSNSITAVYEGDSKNNGSTSAPVNQFVIAATTTTLTSSPNPSTFGQSVIFTATVTSSIGPPPDGEIVTFKQGKTVLGTGTLTGGTVTLSNSTLGVGTKAVTAVYAGDANFATSTSKAVSQVISKATSTTTLTSSQNPSTYGQSVTFTATVAPQFSGTPTGSVVFKDGTKTLKTVTLSGGVASYTTSTLATGTHNITATYNGSTNFIGSSASLTQTVN